MTERVGRALVQAGRESVGAQQADAIAALLLAPRPEIAAAMVGIDGAVLRRWLEDPRFRARYRAARRAALEDVVGRLQQLAAGAVEALARNLTCGVPAVEVEAARMVLAHALPGADAPVPAGEPGKHRHAPGHGEQR